jgi:hypothetical protein
MQAKLKRNLTITTTRSLEAQKMYYKEKSKDKKQKAKKSYNTGGYVTVSEMEKKCGSKASYSESGLRK